MNIAPVVASARLRLRVWSYAFAEAVPKTRQRLHLPPQAAGTDSSECSSSSSSATVRTDAALAARLLDESISRGVPLASILLSSLFLAAAKAVRWEQESPSHGSHQNRPMGVRAQRGFVLGIVCLVMALLSGSAESKAIRYFCSIYAVAAGIWAVNAISIEKPGHTILMATSAALKARGGVAEVTFTPARLAVDCWCDLWETAGRHDRETRGMASPASSFEGFKKLVLGVRRACQRGRKGESRLPLQLFGCIQLEGSADGTRAAPSPEEALGIQTLVEGRGNDCGDEPVPRTTPNISPGLSTLLSVLDAKYTLVYRAASGSERASLQSTAADTRGFPRERGDGGVDDGRGDTTAQENSSPSMGAGKTLGGIDLVLVERAGWPSGKGPKGLLEEAMVFLRDECGGDSAAVGRTC